MRTAMLMLVAGLAFTTAGAGTRADDPPKSWEFIGQTHAVAVVDVRAMVTGHLARVAVREGDAVKKGDLLAEIDSRACRMNLVTAQARLKVAEAKLQSAKIAATNAKKLRQGQAPIIGADELAIAEAKEAEAAAMVMAAKAEVEVAELTLSWTRITAPFDGRVSRIHSPEGSLVIADQSHILTVMTTGPMYVEFYVSEAILMQLHREGRADPNKLDVAVGFVGEQGFPHKAKLDLLPLEIDPRTGTGRFRATVPNPKGLLMPGMSTRIRLTPTSK